MPLEKIDTSTTATAPTRLVAAVWGQAKEGKTTFALTFPEPIYLFNRDYSYKELLANFPNKALYVANYELGDEYHYETYLKAVVQFQKDWIEACNQAQANGGTVVQDKSSQFWAMVSQTLKEKAYRARLQRNPNAKEMQTDYAQANAFMEAILKRPLADEFSRVNACYIMGAKEKYSENGQALNQFSPHGWGETESVVQVVLGLSTKKNVVMGRIDRCRFGKVFEGQELESPTYQSLMDYLS